nr:FAD-binding oxidoreductase [Sphingopyxis panaciterrae]
MKPLSVKNQASDVVIIGAGIVGLTLAVRLHLEGKTVCLIDAVGPASGASYGNAGFLSRGSIFPPVSRSDLWRLPKYLLDPASPLTIRPAYLPDLVPWGMRLIAATRPKRLEQIIAALASLSRDAISSYAPLLSAAAAEELVDVRGSLIVCRTSVTLDQKTRLIPGWRENGIAAFRIDRAKARELEPALSDDIAGAIYLPDNGRCISPGALGRRFAAYLEANGGRMVIAKANSVSSYKGSWLVQTSGGNFEAPQVVVAAGRWSDELLAPFDVTIPLASERGYHLMLPEAGVELSRPCVMAEPFFAATPMIDGLRLAGTVEFAHANAPMNPKRADNLFDLARRYLPGLSREGATRWMGVRPSFPDALPAIGEVSGKAGLFYSFGHQHVGLTLAASSAKLLAELMLNRRPGIDPAPFDLDRFSRGRQPKDII